LPHGEPVTIPPLVRSAAGNRATDRLVRGTSEHETADSPALDFQRASGTGNASPNQDLGQILAVPALEHLRVVATQSTFLVGAYGQRGIRVIDDLRGALERTNRTYNNAYTEYSKHVRAARLEAQNQQDWKNILLGIGVGGGVGLLAGAVLPEGLALGWKVLAEVAGEAAEAVLAGGIQQTGITAVLGTDLEPGGLDPDVLESKIWQRLSALHRSIVNVQNYATFLPLILGNTEYCLGQFRLLAAGASTDMSRAGLVDMATSINRVGLMLDPLNNELIAKLEQLTQLEASITRGPGPPEVAVEANIWIMWIASLKDSESDILDLDAIEDRLRDINVLGPGSILGVDFGLWTSEDDELAALAAARSQADVIQSRYDSLGRTS
jgi:hypothetical protein